MFQPALSNATRGNSRGKIEVRKTFLKCKGLEHELFSKKIKTRLNSFFSLFNESYVALQVNLQEKNKGGGSTRVFSLIFYFYFLHLSVLLNFL